jgi:hypothetical protein
MWGSRQRLVEGGVRGGDVALGLGEPGGVLPDVVGEAPDRGGDAHVRPTGRHPAKRGIDEIAGVHRVVVKRMPNGTTRIVIHFVHNFEGNALLRYRVAEVRHGRVVGFDHARIHIRVDCVQGSCS